MQRYFSTFPGSWPGVGLLLLRIVAGSAAAIQGAVHLTRATEPSAVAWIVGLLAVVSGVALVVGFLTPASGGSAALTILIIVVTSTPTGTSVLVDHLAALFLIVDATALALLGPGAHSLDARFFGRREIIVPRDPTT